MKQKTKRILTILVAIICSISCLNVTASAYTTTVTGSSNISPSNSELKKAKKPIYNSKSVSISDSISNSYEMDIMHYEAAKNGYYAIYTTGKTDTLGKVYEQENFLCFTTKYLNRGTDDDSGDSTNYKLILNLESSEDYYVCTRGWSSRKGSYNLIIEPNNDMVQSNSGGTWINDNINKIEVIEEVSKTYLTREQTKLYFQLLRDEQTKKQ